MNEQQLSTIKTTSKGVRFLFWCMALFIPIVGVLRFGSTFILSMLATVYEGTEKAELIIFIRSSVNYIMGLLSGLSIPITIGGVLLLILKK